MAAVSEEVTSAGSGEAMSAGVEGVIAAGVEGVTSAAFVDTSVDVWIVAGWGCTVCSWCGPGS